MEVYANAVRDLEGTSIAKQAVIAMAHHLDEMEAANRRAMIQQVGATHPGIIGGPMISENDQRLSIFTGDILLQQTGSELMLSGTESGPFVDSRGTVTASLAGIVVPDSIKTESQWRRMWRHAGIAAFDVLEGKARSHYGVTAWRAGATGGIPYRKDGGVGPGDYMARELPPLNKDARDQWEASLFHDASHMPGAYKPVLAKWSPYGALDDLSDGLQGAIEAVVDRGVALDALDSDGIADERDEVALRLSRFVLNAVYLGVLALEDAGALTLTSAADMQARAMPVAQADITTLSRKVFVGNALTDLAAPALAARILDRNTLAVTLGLKGERLGAAKTKGPVAGRILGVAFQPLLSSTELANAFSAGHFLPGQKDDGAALARLQDQAGLDVFKATQDLFFDHASSVVARATRNAQKGQNVDLIIMS